MDSKTVKQLEQLINKALANVATKDDLKSELAKYATKDDLKSELAKYATKDDLEIQREMITNDITSVMKIFVEALDEKKADKTDTQILQARIERIEEKIAT